MASRILFLDNFFIGHNVRILTKIVGKMTSFKVNAGLFVTILVQNLSVCAMKKLSRNKIIEAIGADWASISILQNLVAQF